METVNHLRLLTLLLLDRLFMTCLNPLGYILVINELDLVVLVELLV